MFMFNVKRGYYPTYICNMFEYNTIYYHYCTRQQQKFHIPLCRENFSKNSIRYKGVLIWNYFVDILEHNCSYHTFKKRIKNHLLYNEITF